MLRSIACWTIVAYLLSAATYELVLALQHSSSEKGLVWGLAILAMLLGVVLALRRGPATALFAPAAAFFATARSYTGDPYYEPTFRRYADGGNVSPTLIYVLLGLALVAGVTTRIWRRTAPVETTFVLLLLALTTLFSGLH